MTGEMCLLDEIWACRLCFAGNMLSPFGPRSPEASRIDGVVTGTPDKINVFEVGSSGKVAQARKYRGFVCCFIAMGWAT